MGFFERIRVKGNRNTISKEPSLEDCINEFIKQYGIVKWQKTRDEKGIDDYAYEAYRRMFCDMIEPEGENFSNQKKLMKSKTLAVTFLTIFQPLKITFLTLKKKKVNSLSTPIPQPVTHGSSISTAIAFSKKAKPIKAAPSATSAAAGEG